ncbi:MAG: polysaccharide biosynthesis tyrosine autokinase [Gemmataceae bacterium]
MSNVPALVNDLELPEMPATRSSVNLLQVIWQRKSLVILGIVLGTVGGFLYYAQRAPTYMSRAAALVVPKNADALMRMNLNELLMHDYMQTQTTVLRSHEIARRAASTKEVKDMIDAGSLKSFPGAKFDDVVTGIMESLTVSRENREGNAQTTGNNVVILSFKGPDSRECEIFLRNIIKGYQDFLDETYERTSKDFQEKVIEARNTLDVKVQEAEKALKKFRDEHNQTLIFVKSREGSSSVASKSWEVLSNDIALKRTALSTDKKYFEYLSDYYEKYGPERTIALIAASGAKNLFNGDSDIEKEITKAEIQRDTLKAERGPNHPDVRAITERIDAMRNSYFRHNKDAPVETHIDAAKNFIKSLGARVELNELIVNQLQADFEKQKDDMEKIRTAENEEEVLKNKVTMARSFFNAIVNRIEQFDLSKGGGYTAKTITPAGYGFKVSPIPFQVFTAAGLLGTLLGIGLAYLAELSDKSFRNPVEIRRRLGLPVIGHVPFLAADEKAQELVAAGSSTVDPMLITHYQSSSIGAEAYRGVRTALYFSTRGEAHQVIQVTSPNVGDGKSTLAANLAASIAQSGKRTLLIDADFRKPRVHKIFNVPAQVGMASVMAGQAELASAIQPTAVPNLSVLPCGPRPVNPSELLTSPKFKELLDELRTQFDFVIVDTPPILVVTDPAVVAPRVDGVILCIRVTKNGRPFAERAREVLASLGANVIGVVVNGFGSQVGGGKYGYEHYQYGYGEGYSYTYGYTYADKDAESYYGDKTEPELALPPAEKT